ncbi:WD40-repeat-containing domain protein [Polychytrium aggregatum]|uniref:WD40-repeat-containing domain protein n=1 Tax=Polychytrium aggregatum TaxID=110093 RepID=UPI0022FDBB9C|nr:WD40-repeat-containing domain protein [Polychytrium aggregatum]KAI9203747.1 WD40-repeat-containing domain protein [Polychytrium aggregatum]
MNTGGKAHNDILFINFNQDFSCISVGTRHGHKIYNCDPFGKVYGKSDGGIGIIEMMFCTSLVALVGAGEQPAFSPRRLQITNTKRESTICELTYVSAIVAVKLNRKRLVVRLEEHIYIYDISNMKLLHSIDTSPSPNPLCALSPSSENCFMAYPTNTSGSTGELLIFDTITLQAVNIIQAHKSPIGCIAFSFDGTMVATSSDKGTVIRVYSVPDGQKLFQFRRGTYPARIYSITFNLPGTLLSVSSDTDTVHIFKLEKDGSGNGAGSGSGAEGEPLATAPTPKKSDRSLERKSSGSDKKFSVYDSLRSPLANATAVASAAVGSYLPDVITEMWEPTRDFAFCKIPTHPGSSGSGSSQKGTPNLCAISSGIPHVMVVTAAGYFYQFSLDQERGGECQLLKQYSLLDPEESAGATR